MASVEDDLSEGESIRSEKEVNLVKNNYRCCVKKVCTTQVCMNCGGLYHNSCAKKKNIKIINERYVECCDEVQDGRRNLNREEILELKIEHLSKLLVESNEKNEILKENNSILKENNKLLKQRLDDMEKKYAEKTDNEREQYSDILKTDRIGDKITNKTSDSKIVPRVVVQMHEDAEVDRRHLIDDTNFKFKTKQQQQSKFTSTSKNQGNKEIHIRNINNETSYNHDGFERVQRRRPKSRRLGTTRVSEEEEKTGFVGAERRAWIYLYRIKRHVKAQQVEEYVKKNPAFTNEKVEVKELPSEPTQLKCFVLTAPLEKKNQLYDPSFWPQNVGVKRFNFGHFQKYKPSEDFL